MRGNNKKKRRKKKKTAIQNEVMRREPYRHSNANATVNNANGDEQILEHIESPGKFIIA